MRYISAVLAIFLLLACGCNPPAALSNRAIDFNETAAQAADTQLLLNIVRAAHRNPTHYTAISQIRESRVTEGSFQLSGVFPFGPKATSIFPVTAAASARGNEQPSFDVAPLDNKAAASGLFRPMEPQTLITYWRQGWPKYVLLYLFVDDVLLNPVAQRLCGIDRELVDNNAYNAENFRRIGKVFDCVGPIIKIGEKPDETVFLRDAPISPEEVLKKLPELDKGDFTVKESKDKKGQRVYTVSKKQKKLVFRITLKGQLATASASAPGERRSVKAGPEPSLSFSIRSVDGIIYYLGEMVRSQLRGEPPPLIPGYDRPEVLFRVDVDDRVKNGGGIEVEYLGRRFAIARTPRDHDRTLTVLTLLTQVFSLYRESIDLPKTTAVQVVGAP